MDTPKCPSVIKVMASQLTLLFGAGRTFAARNKCKTATTQCAITTNRVSMRAFAISLIPSFIPKLSRMRFP